MWQLPRIPVEDVLVYLRKSRTDDPTLTVAEVLSKHEQMLDEWVERNMADCGGRIPEENRFREVVSGETIDSRPAIKEVLRLAESPRYKALLIVEPQRLSRGDLEDIGRLVKILRYSNTIVITLQYIYDLSDEHDRDAFERELKRGNEFLEYQKRIMNNGRLLSVENGNFVGNTPPYGYRKVQVREGKRVCHTLEPIPEEAEIVKMIFDMYLKGMGTVKIGDRLVDLGIPAPAGGKWGRSSVANILENIHYVGKVRWNYHKVKKTVKDGDLVRSRPKADEYLVFTGKHPAIIDQETFDAVQAKKGSLPRVKSKKQLSNPLAGILYCNCGAFMQRRQFIKHGVKTSEPRFVCRISRRCKGGSCLASELLDRVKIVLERAIKNFETHIENGTDYSEFEKSQKLVEMYKQRLAELEDDEADYWEKYTLEGMPKRVFDRKIKEITDERATLEQNICMIEDSIPEPINIEEKIADFKTALNMMEHPDADITLLNAALKKCIKRISYYRPRREADMLFNAASFELRVDLAVPSEFQSEFTINSGELLINSEE